jgi:hypothetical protein
LARLLPSYLDALSHRLDAWLTAAGAERLQAQRAAAAGQAPAIGAYGYLTDVRPRTQPRSRGHVHAPSLGHAATAAVLRAGYLGQRRAAWADQVARARAARDAATGPARDVAQAALDAAEAGLAQLLPLGEQGEATLPLAVDVSSRRVRQARRTLAAVRAGQPLGALLGYQFERDLADDGLQQYLAAFRKLTRFSTGSALEALEDARREARRVLADRLRQLAGLQADVTPAAKAVDDASAALTAAREREAAARAAAAPYVAMEQELADLDARLIPELEAALARVAAERPTPGVTQREIEVP